jgi:hypothetical protein
VTLTKCAASSGQFHLSIIFSGPLGHVLGNPLPGTFPISTDIPCSNPGGQCKHFAFQNVVQLSFPEQYLPLGHVATHSVEYSICFGTVQSGWSWAQDNTSL